MGLLGAGLNAQHLAELLNWQSSIVQWIIFYAWLNLGVISLQYLWQNIILDRQLLKQEWTDPSQRSFFPSITLTLLLFMLSLVPFAQHSAFAQEALQNGYFVVVFFHVLLNLRLISSWLFHQDIEIGHHQPSWFILLSGNFVVVIAGLSVVDLLVMPIWYEVLWLFFSVGLFLWLSFTVSLFYRLIFDKPLHNALRPSLFIFLAPPSLAVISSILLSQSTAANPDVLAITPLTWMLYSFASVMLCVWLTLIRYFYQSGLSLAGWAYVYPLAAYGLATQYMAEYMGSALFENLSILILIIVLSFIALLSAWLFKQQFLNKAG
ncbi:MAG: tellurite resistance protein [Thiomicrorhabdus sp.]|nr:MAG: tellurite resistance protein [Thiomicrorhabdus sp.]